MFPNLAISSFSLRIGATQCSFADPKHLHILLLYIQLCLNIRRGCSILTRTLSRFSFSMSNLCLPPSHRSLSLSLSSHSAAIASQRRPLEHVVRLALCFRHVVLISASVQVCSRRQVICRQAPPRLPIAARSTLVARTVRWPQALCATQRILTLSGYTIGNSEVSLALCFSRSHALLCSHSVRHLRLWLAGVVATYVNVPALGLRYCALFSLAAQHALLV